MFTNIFLALNGLSANKMRSALTMLGITIGVAVVIILISLGQAVEGFILSQFSMLGSDLVYVFGELEDQYGRVTWLTMSDAKALADPYRVPDAIAMMPVFEYSGVDAIPVVYQDRSTRVNLHGATPLWIDMVNQDVVAGRFFTDQEVVSGARVTVLGQSVVENLFEGVYPILGKHVRVKNVEFEVIGVLESMGSISMGSMDSNNLLLMPITTVQRRLVGERTTRGDYPVTSIMIRARAESLIDVVAQQIRQTLREEHHIIFNEDEDFTVMTQSDLMSSVESVTGVLTIFLGAIAGISLIVGGIGIMNIMLVTVNERTHEIGIRKAVGARRIDILLQFLTESVVLAVFGGAMGVAAAWGLTHLLAESMPALTVTVQVSSILLATFVSVTIGLFFGIYPANRAATLNPIDALRYE